LVINNYNLVLDSLYIYLYLARLLRFKRIRFLEQRDCMYTHMTITLKAILGQINSIVLARILNNIHFGNSLMNIQLAPTLFILIIVGGYMH